jgi:RNA polymerase sigma-70 factor (ECF subfamily)
VNSALQRARAKLERELPARSQQETLRTLGDERARQLVARFVEAWNRADIPAIVAMMSEDASFSMPPLPTWFRGREDIATFVEALLGAARPSGSSWRFEATRASGQPALIGRRLNPDTGQYELGALLVLTFDDELIDETTAFLGPGVLGRFQPGEVLRDRSVTGWSGGTPDR